MLHKVIYWLPVTNYINLLNMYLQDANVRKRTLKGINEKYCLPLCCTRITANNANNIYVPVINKEVLSRQYLIHVNKKDDSNKNCYY